MPSRLVEGRRRRAPAEPGQLRVVARLGVPPESVPRAPQPGYAVLYGEPGHAHHIGVVARLVPDLTAHWGRRVLVIEGNTSLGVYNRDGWIVAEKIMDPTHLIGFVAPFPTDP
jgi:hypothetical protein